MRLRLAIIGAVILLLPFIGLGLAFFPPEYSIKIVAVLIGVAIAALIVLSGRPIWGLYLLAVVIILLGEKPGWADINPEPVSLYTVATYTVTIPDFLVLITAFALLLHGTVRKELSYTPSPMNLAMLLFTVSIGIGVIVGISNGSTAHELGREFEFRGIIYLPLLFFLATSILNSEAKITRFLWFMLALSCLRALYGVYRFVTGPSLPGAGQYTLLHPADGLLLMVMVTVALAWSLRGRLSGAKVRILGLLSAPMLFTVAFSYKRGIWLALGISLLLLALLLPARQKMAIALVAGTIGLACLAGGYLGFEPVSFLGTRLSTIAEPTATSELSYTFRYIEARNVLRTMGEHPVLGVGFGQPYIRYLSHPFDELLAPYVTHNGYLYVWMKMGIPGLAALGILLLAFFVTALGTKPSSPLLQATVIALIAGVAGSLLDIGLEPLLVTMKWSALMGLFMGIAAAISRLSREQAKVQDVARAMAPPQPLRRTEEDAMGEILP